jgi:hypothetical protein
MGNQPNKQHKRSSGNDFSALTFAFSQFVKSSSKN